MPSNSKSQARFMRMAAHDAEFAKSRNISQQVAKEWYDEDKKKRKEDPEWWEKLPDRAEKKDDKGNDPEESFEGFGDVLKRILGFPTPEEKAAAEKMISELKHDSSKITEEMLKKKTIILGNSATLMHLWHWPNHRWLSSVEENFGAFGRWLINYLKLRANMTQALEKIYEEAKRLPSPKEAYRHAKPLAEGVYADYALKIDHSAVKFTNLTLVCGKIGTLPHSKVLERRKPLYGGMDSYIQALTLPEAKKCCELMLKLSGLLDQCFDIGDREWYLDDTDDYRWWISRFPDDDEDIAHLLNLFPVAGEFHGMEIGENRILADMEKGLAEILFKSLK